MERSVEIQLVRELSEGSVNAFNDLYKNYCDHLFSFSFSLLKDKDCAEEVVQHVFIKIWEKRSNLNPELSFQAYIFKITKNHVFKLLHDRLRNKIHAESIDNHLVSLTDNMRTDIIYSEFKNKARKVIINLPCQRKSVFIMRRNLNLSNKEIAEKLNISVNTVKRHMNIALNSLNQALINQ
jgi:RNA polymerase sigma-70 factor (family 1)